MRTVRQLNDPKVNQLSETTLSLRLDDSILTPSGNEEQVPALWQKAEQLGHGDVGS